MFAGSETGMITNFQMKKFFLKEDLGPGQAIAVDLEKEKFLIAKVLKIKFQKIIKNIINKL